MIDRNEMDLMSLGYYLGRQMNVGTSRSQCVRRLHQRLVDSGFKREDRKVVYSAALNQLRRDRP